MYKKIAREKERRRGEKTLKMLEVLSHGALVTGELCMAIAPAYSYSQARGIKKRRASLSKFFAEEGDRQRFYSLLAHMQKTGLVAKESKKGLFSWSITAKGREKKLAIARSHEKKQTPPIPSPRYPTKRSNGLIIVIFDVPEKEKYKREWLRAALIDMEFSLVQKSVWMGSVQLPPAFIADLKKYDVLPYVKIFSATELGNLYE